MLKDDSKTLKDVGIKDGAKIMMIGSSITDVMNTAQAPTNATAEIAKEGSNPFPFCFLINLIFYLYRGSTEGEFKRETSSQKSHR